MTDYQYAARWADGTFLPINTQITSFRGEPWVYDGTSHPRKIDVHWDEVDIHRGDGVIRDNRTFYPDVFNSETHGGLGIWDSLHEVWTFTAEQAKTGNSDLWLNYAETHDWEHVYETQEEPQDGIGWAILGETVQA